MKRWIGVLVLLLIGELALGQNLILNPSFEDVNQISARWSGTHIHFDRRIKDWDSPTQGSPDLLYIDHLDKMFPPRPNVDLKPYTPRTGKFMIGIKTYGCATNTLHCKEYIQCKVTEPIQAGESYFYEYWVQPINTSVKVNSFGLAVSKIPLKELMRVGALDMYPVSANEEILDGEAGVWHRVSGVFEADSDYDYIIIGNFGADKFLQIKEEKGGIDYGYYLLDDVVLRPLHSKSPPVLKTNEVIVLENILFEFDKAEIQPASKPQLQELVDYLRVNASHHLEIMGHTDSQGSQAHNLKLSQDRAASIKAYLVQQGIYATRIHDTGHGSTFPIVPNDTEVNRAINRRVEIKIVE